MDSDFTWAMRARSWASSGSSSCERRNACAASSSSKSSRRQSMTESPWRISRIASRSAIVNSSRALRPSMPRFTSYISAALWGLGGYQANDAEGERPSGALAGAARLDRRDLRPGVPTQRQGAHEDAERHGEHRALPHERSGAAGDGDGGDGHEIPGGQLHSIVSLRVMLNTS